MTVVQIDFSMSHVDYVINQIVYRLEDTSLALFLKGAVEPMIQARVKARFAGEGDDASGPWAPLRYPTQQIRANAGYGGAHPINNRTGQLERFITGTSGSVGTVAGGVGLTYPGNQPTGDLHDKVLTAQQGIPNPKTVKRPVLALSPTDLAMTQTSLAAYIETGVI